MTIHLVSGAREAAVSQREQGDWSLDGRALELLILMTMQLVIFPMGEPWDGGPSC
jgi:hypothetical protein